MMLLQSLTSRVCVYYMVMTERPQPRRPHQTAGSSQISEDEGELVKPAETPAVNTQLDGLDVSLTAFKELLSGWDSWPCLFVFRGGRCAQFTLMFSLLGCKKKGPGVYSAA